MRGTATMLLLGTLAVPALAAAQGHGRMRRTSTSAGEVALPANPARSSAEVEQFQRALRAEGCDPGAIDGIIGPRTSQAIACARRKGRVPSAPGAMGSGSGVPAGESDVFTKRPLGGDDAGGVVAPNPPAPQTTRTIVTGIPAPTVNGAHDSTVGRSNASSDSLRDRVRRGNPSGARTPATRPDTSHR